jgi:hypothetical protein
MQGRGIGAAIGAIAGGGKGLRLVPLQVEAAVALCPGDQGQAAKVSF